VPRPFLRTPPRGGERRELGGAADEGRTGARRSRRGDDPTPNAGVADPFDQAGGFTAP